MCQLTGGFLGSVSDGSTVPVDSSSSQVCGGGSCYDPATNQFCASSSDGQQVCVKGPSQDHSSADAGKTPQYCGTINGVTVCAGSPSAPTPNSDPLPPVTSDQNVMTSDGQGAPPQQTQVTTYDTNDQGNNRTPGSGSTSTGSLGNGGNNGSTGESEPDGTCQDGRRPGAGGCGAGYTDNGCNAPPFCSGDPLLCAGVKEQHATRCSEANRAAQLANAASAAAAGASGSVFGPAGDDPDPGSVVSSVTIGGSGDGGGGSGSGSGLNDSGWSLPRTCPIKSKSVAVMGMSIPIDFTAACGPLGFGGLLVMIMAYLVAARILFIQ